jgi:hypothetical protein
MTRYGAQVIGGLAVALAVTCSREAPVDPRARIPVPEPGAAYTSEQAEYPRLSFASGDTTSNDRCPVQKRKLNPRLPPTYVNGVPIGYC